MADTCTLPVLLVVDPDNLLRWSVQTYFARWYDVRATSEVDEAMRWLGDGGCHALIVSEDLTAADLSGLEKAARAKDPQTLIVHMGTRLSPGPRSVHNTVYVEKPHVLPRLIDLFRGGRRHGCDQRDVRMFIDDYMTRDPITVRDDAPLAQAHALLDKHRFHHLPVLDESGRLVGIVTDRDVRSAVGFEKVLSEKLSVSEVMTADPVTVAPKMTLDEALAIFCSNRFGALPVCDDGKLVGIISTHDVLRAFFQVLGLDQPGCRIEVALPNIRNDLAHVFEALKACPSDIVSAVVSRMRRDGGEPALYLRVSGNDARPIERFLRDKALIVLEPE